ALVCDTPVAAQVLFGYYSSSGNLISEATVFSAPPATSAQFWADGDGGSRLGIALVNGSTAAKTYVIAAFDGKGQEVARTTVQVNAASQMARFAQDLLPLPPNFLGFIRVYSAGSDLSDVYAIGLKFTGGAFTTIPALALVSKPTTTTTTTTNGGGSPPPSGGTGACSRAKC